MANRFGRNQRRAMRAQVAALETAKDAAVQKALQHGYDLLDTRDRLHRWADDVRRLMGSDSAFNERVKVMTGDQWDGPMLQVSPGMSLPPIGRMPGPMSDRMAEYVIMALIWRLGLSRDEFRQFIRIELHNRYGEPVGYVIPERQLWTTKDTEVLARHIAHEMGAYMEKPRGR